MRARVSIQAFQGSRNVEELANFWVRDRQFGQAWFSLHRLINADAVALHRFGNQPRHAIGFRHRESPWREPRPSSHRVP